MERLRHKGIQITDKYTICVYSRGIESGIVDEPRRRNLRLEDEPKAEDATVMENELNTMISAATENSTKPSESGTEDKRVTMWKYSLGFTFLVLYKLINVDRTPTDLLKSGRAKLQLASQEADRAPPTTLLGGGDCAGLRSENYGDLADNNCGRNVDDKEGIDYADRIRKGKAHKKCRQTVE